MGSITLVRHGQASLFSDDYDRLSSLGEDQARRLGAHWVETGVSFDRAIAGPRKRQAETGRLVAETLRAAGKAFPEIEVLEHFDEMHAEELLRTQLPTLVERHDHLRALVTDLGEGSSGPDAFRRFQRVFEAVMGMWIEGRIEAPGVESFAEFCARVAGGLGALRAGDAKGARIVAFTSGGTIAASMKAALGFEDKKVLDLAGVIKNASLTELVFSKTRLTPTLFNSVAHLPPALFTLR